MDIDQDCNGSYREGPQIPRGPYEVSEYGRHVARLSEGTSERLAANVTDAGDSELNLLGYGELNRRMSDPLILSP